MTEQRPPSAGGAGGGAGGASTYCAACGTRLAPDARFCTNCGAPQVEGGPRAPAGPPPAEDSTKVLPVARVAERERRVVHDDGPPVYAPAPPFNWTPALLALLGLLVLALGLLLFAQSQDDDGGTTTTTVPTTAPTTVTTLATTTTTLRATTSTTGAATTTSTVPPSPSTTAPVSSTIAPTTAPPITLTPQP